MDIVDEGFHIIVFKFHAEIEILTIGSIFGEVYICLAICGSEKSTLHPNISAISVIFAVSYRLILAAIGKKPTADVWFKLLPCHTCQTETTAISRRECFRLGKA